MADNLTPEKRRSLMSSVRGSNTGPEMLLRSALHKAGYRYALHRKDLPGKPDLVFSRRRKIIFMHGCYWHGHECNQGRLAKTNEAYWANKIANNQERDQRVIGQLEALGWGVSIVWSCQLRSAQKLANTIANVIRFLEN